MDLEVKVGDTELLFLVVGDLSTQKIGVTNVENVGIMLVIVTDSVPEEVVDAGLSHARCINISVTKQKNSSEFNSDNCIPNIFIGNTAENIHKTHPSSFD